MKHRAVALMVALTTPSLVIARADNRPGPMTTVVGAPAQAGANDAAASVEAWLKGYDAAFLTKDLNRIASFYHPDVTIYEGAGIKQWLGRLSRSASRS